MDISWIQTITTIGTILPITVGSVWTFYNITSNRIDALDGKIIRLDEKWEERFFRFEEKMIKMEENWDIRFIKMDEKWERLFDRLYANEKKEK